MTAAKRSSFDATLITIGVGSRGVPNPSGFNQLKEAISLSRREYDSLITNSIAKAIEGSFLIWTNRNHFTVVTILLFL